MLYEVITCGVILTMTMILMTGLAMTRERERGTFENLLATPATPFEVMTVITSYSIHYTKLYEHCPQICCCPFRPVPAESGRIDADELGIECPNVPQELLVGHECSVHKNDLMPGPPQHGRHIQRAERLPVIDLRGCGL